MQKNLHHFAAMGAKVRLEQLTREIRELLAAFPELNRDVAEMATHKETQSERMKRYWATRRAEKAAGG